MKNLKTVLATLIAAAVPTLALADEPWANAVNAEGHGLWVLLVEAQGGERLAMSQFTASADPYSTDQTPVIEIIGLPPTALGCEARRAPTDANGAVLLHKSIVSFNAVAGLNSHQFVFPSPLSLWPWGNGACLYVRARTGMVFSANGTFIAPQAPSKMP